MYAVIRAGGKQYRVAPGDVIRVETQEDKDGKVQFGDVLAVSAEAGNLVTGGAGASVTGEVVEQGRGAKILVFHYKRKKQYKSCVDTGRTIRPSGLPRLLLMGNRSKRRSFRRKRKR